MKVPFYLPDLGEAECREVVASIQSNWLSKGPRTLEFESEFARYVESDYAVGLHSCTAGLHLAQLALGVGAGDEVITTPYTFAATANTIIHCGATPVFVDIDPLTQNIDVEKIEQAITTRTKAIIPVHYAGFPCEMDRIRELADHYHLAIIEDAAHALYTQYKGRPIGSIGDVTCFSFYATKNLTTGEGGMVTTSDEELATYMRKMSLHGMSRNAWNRYSEKGSWYYEVEDAGFKCNMTDLQASLGLVQLQKLEGMQKLREEHAREYGRYLGECDALQLPYETPEHRHAWHLYPIRLQLERITLTRDQLIEELKEAGIGTSVHFIPVPHHPYYRTRGYRLEDYPRTTSTYQSTISLPFYPGLKSAQIQYVSETILSLIDSHIR